jgi:hypothetical protein
MRQAVLDHYEEADVVIKTAAVADFRPKFVAQDKVKDMAESTILNAIQIFWRSWASIRARVLVGLVRKLRIY